MKYETVIFDLDGTLLDTLDDLCDSVNHSLSRFGLPAVSRGFVRASVGNGSAVLIERCAPNLRGLPLFDELLAFYLDWYPAHCRIKTAPYPGITELVSRLHSRGVSIAVASNKPDAAVAELCALFFGDCVSFTVGDRPSLPRKPAPDSLLMAVRALDAKAESCVYVGDTEVDVLTARNAGLPCISVLWGFRDRPCIEQAGATVFASDAAELSALLS